MAFTGCEWNEWFEKPIPDTYTYIPDSLKFKQKTGDIAIFIKHGKTAEFDTFNIRNVLYIDQVEENSYGEKNYLHYENNNSRMLLYIFFSNYENSIFSCLSQTHYLCWANVDTVYEEILIENKMYNNVGYSHACVDRDGTEVYNNGVYHNTKNGLIRYVTSENDTFNLYEYRPIK